MDSIMKKKKEWHEFLEFCLQSKSNAELDETLTFFLTIEEKENIIDRYLITKALMKEEMPQRKMANVLNVSIAKISRGSNALKIMASSLRKRLFLFINS